jgi:hypothetical protein
VPEKVIPDGVGQAARRFPKRASIWTLVTNLGLAPDFQGTALVGSRRSGIRQSMVESTPAG